MIRRSDITVSDTNNTPEPGVWITVKNADGSLASIYNDNGTAEANPFQSGSGGLFVYNVINSGTYTEEFRLSLSDAPRKIQAISLGSSLVVTPLQYGAKADGVTDDSAAFTAALSALQSAATNGYGYGQKGSPKLFVPAGVYYLGTTTLDLTFGIILEGESVGYTGAGSSVLKWAAGVTGIRFEAANTSGTTTVTSRGYASYPIVRNLYLQGTYSGTESEAHGIDMRQNGAVEDCSIYNFAGDGVHLYATAGSGGPTEGNDNGWFLKRVFVQGCRNGFYWNGADVNAGLAIACNAIANRQWGFWDSSFLGNTHLGHHCQGNGAVAGTHPPCWVSYSGNRYVVNQAQVAGASTNAPSGTTADNTWWYYYGAGGVDTTINCPAWTSGTTYRAGGAYSTDDTGNANNVFVGCYIEGSQPFAQFVTPTLVLGGSMNPNVKGSPVLTAGISSVISSGGLQANGNSTLAGTTNVIGPQSGTAADSVLNLYNTNVSSQLIGVSTANGTLGSFDMRFGTGIRYNVNNSSWAHVFQVNGTEVGRFTSAGLTLTAVTVATLPAAGTAGRRSFVTDANATTFATVVAGGGTNKVPVYDDGAAWRIG